LQEDLIQEIQDADGLNFEDRTGQKPLKMMMLMVVVVVVVVVI
jgi:hypothetical protein